MKKIFDGSFSLNLSQISVIPLFDRLSEILRLTAKIKEITLHIESRFDREISADEGRLMQVLLNLASNGIKFTPRGGTVEVLAEEKIDPASSLNVLSISIMDTGIGIKREKQADVFTMFGMVDEKSRACDTGIGLGLYLSKYIITAMNGKLTLSSEVGKGTTISIALPISPLLTEEEPCNESRFRYRHSLDCGRLVFFIFLTRLGRPGGDHDQQGHTIPHICRGQLIQLRRRLFPSVQAPRL